LNDSADPIREGLNAALTGVQRGRAVADRLCGCCVELLGVDDAALSVMDSGVLSRAFGASSSLATELGELQFMLGEGPCLSVVDSARPVLVADLSDAGGDRWPAFAAAALQLGVHAVFALPVTAAGVPAGALQLYRHCPGGLDVEMLTGGLLAAELAALPVLDLMGMDMNAATTDSSSAAWSELRDLCRVEVYQAAGMLIGQLKVSPVVGLVRLRGYAFAHGMSATEVAWDIIERRLRLDNDEAWRSAGQNGGPDG
jgi:hypothetical protein